MVDLQLTFSGRHDGSNSNGTALLIQGISLNKFVPLVKYFALIAQSWDIR